MLRYISAALVLGVSLAFSSATLAVPQQVYFNNFDGTESFGAGVTGSLSGVTTTEGVQGYGAVGFSGNMLRNTTTGNPAASTTLTLNNLPAHDSWTINFGLAIIDSWDSVNGAAGATPDFFNIAVLGGDNNFFFSPTFANASGTVTSNLETNIGGGCQPRGFNGDWCDRAYDLTFNLDQTESTLVINFFASGAGWQGGTDESWAIENLQVLVNVTQVNGAPEPMTLSLLAIALAGLGFSRRKRSS